jgi:restriction system protein
MIPDYQTLMRPVLRQIAKGERHIRSVITDIEDELGLTEAERAELIASGTETVISNRTHWAKTYLKQAGLVEPTKRAHFIITPRGEAALNDSNVEINNQYLKQFEEFRRFLKGNNRADQTENGSDADSDSTNVTPDEAIRTAHRKINDSLASELLDRVRQMPPNFFEELIVKLLLAMGYGGSSEEAGRAIGKSGDGGIDGVIDQDPLGVDQIYVQAKRYAENNSIGSGAIRDFFGGLSLRRAQKGIFVTTSSFTSSAVETAAGLGGRIVLIDGLQLTNLMIRYSVGCRSEHVLHIKKVDEEFFDSE